MKLECKYAKGVVVLMCGETQNTFQYNDNKELFEILEKMKNYEDGIDIYDFTDKFVYYVFDAEDLEELRKVVKESEKNATIKKSIRK